MRVLMMPDYRPDNPYQQLLAEALRGGEGLDVVFPAGYRRVFPLARTAREIGADVLHLHWLEPYVRPSASLPRVALRGAKALVDLLLVRASGVRVVWTIHNEASHERRHPRLERALLRAAERLACATIVHEAVRRAAHPDAVVIPHGHFGAAYAQAVEQDQARAAIGEPAEGRLFLCFGLLRPYKGVEDLLDAWAASGLGRDHRLLVVGAPQDPAYGRALEERARALPGVRIVAEFVPSVRVHLYFSAADVVVLPYRAVSTSGTLLLALTFGKPVVVPDVATLRETLGDPAPALLYEGGSSADLADGLVRAAQMDLSPLSAAARARARRFDWRAIAAATRRVYEGAPGGSPGAEGHPVPSGVTSSEQGRLRTPM